MTVLWNESKGSTARPGPDVGLDFTDQPAPAPDMPPQPPAVVAPNTPPSFTGAAEAKSKANRKLGTHLVMPLVYEWIPQTRNMSSRR